MADKAIADKVTAETVVTAAAIAGASIPDAVTDAGITDKVIADIVIACASIAGDGTTACPHNVRDGDVAALIQAPDNRVNTLINSSTAFTH